MVNKIAQIDSNFKLTADIPENTVWVEAYDGPFEINGLYKTKELKKYIRLPEKFKTDMTVNDGVRNLLHHTAGGRIRFSTNSPYVAVEVEVSDIEAPVFMTSCGQSGVDFYMSEKGSADYQFRRSFAPHAIYEEKDRFYTGIAYFKDYDLQVDSEHEVMLNLPLYNGINSIKIGVAEGSYTDAPVAYSIKKPICFYGASVTQGGCASRPGNNYPNYISRWLNSDFINLGFSGSARGEFALADYMASLDISALVVDMDMSINDIEIFKNTHYSFYERLRSKNNNVPLIFMSMPKFPKIEVKSTKFRNYSASKKIIKETIRKGFESGDKNLYYIEGEKMFGESFQDSCTVDFCHPNDLGFFRMAESILPTIKKALKI